ncbi:HesA/MoeB/ThiF family protein [Idiomarina sp. M1R2S28]|uniref:HesA/MoeB/ThiF family protein n=1 Tax=Idiomarina rhizosphaerae TaxID=2961572 RepID=A0A9X2FUM1_9GAMM|nr:HesA/MoeB/ThiF family protein [Idiomarina rhizosphaerae]MCP1339562.1 HesA/MoeB/ThiF family protein [Idiomarina rhizosphaerae]
MLNNEQLLRYSSNLLMKEIGEVGQQRLLKSHVLIIGLGGLGCPASQYLASSGVGQITLVDHDTISLSNLQRQTLYSSDDIGLSKARQAGHSLSQLNPDIRITALEEQACEDNLDALIKQADLVLDCTDNRETRYLINHSCYRLNTPLVSAAARGFNGQIIALNPEHSHGCYQCLYPDNVNEPLNCSNAGIAGPVVGIMGASQALQAINYFTGHELNWGYLQTFNGLSQNWQQLSLPRTASCPVCGGKNARSS